MKLVAIGCSWGGLAALTTVLGGLPEELDAAVVVAQHRATDESLLGSLLQRETALPVHEAVDKQALEPGAVYLAPPDYHLLVERGWIALSTEAPVQFARPSLDVLFETAADAYGADCAAVVMTGASDDGAAGFAEIAGRGGVAIVQDPAEAERSEMPAAALAAVPAATVLPLSAIPQALVEVCGTRSRV
ncbi:MAG TPA: chemotaxis protein CheB [Gaiellaceae bacterium]|nr:chemotaxis protein CheB [Gaiellaceae bacterium]